MLALSGWLRINTRRPARSQRAVHAQSTASIGWAGTAHLTPPAPASGHAGAYCLVTERLSAAAGRRDPTLTCDPAIDPPPAPSERCTENVHSRLSRRR